MIHIVLVEPQIAPNTGNIIRLAANTGAKLHLVEPLGFKVDDAKLKRAGLDYHDWASIDIHAHFEAYLQQAKPKHWYAISTKGQIAYTDIVYPEDTALIFGAETHGLSQTIRDNATQVLRIPMQPNNRSLNLANAVAIVTYEVWRQQDFHGAALPVLGQHG